MAESDSKMLTLRLSGGPLSRPVLSRAIGAAAARGDMPVDRMGDAGVVADLLAHAIDGASAEVEIGEGDGWVSVDMGPLDADRIELLSTSTAVADAAPLLEQLTNAFEVTERGDAAWVSVRFEY